MTEYYVIKDKNTGLYFRGKGVNRWGEYFNQASIYRVKGMAEHMIEEISWRGEQAEVVPIKIIEPTADVVEVKHGKWYLLDECCNEGVYCSVCHKKVYRTNYANQKLKSKFCPNCGAKMDKRSEDKWVLQ